MYCVIIRAKTRGIVAIAKTIMMRVVLIVMADSGNNFRDTLQNIGETKDVLIRN